MRLKSNPERLVHAKEMNHMQMGILRKTSPIHDDKLVICIIVSDDKRLYIFNDDSSRFYSNISNRNDIFVELLKTGTELVYE